MTQAELDEYQKIANLLYAIKKPLMETDSYSDLVDALEERGISLSYIEETLRPIDADLHTHSNFSDGQLQPRRIVRLAHLMQMKAVAIADHDNVSGVVEAVREGAEIGIGVVAGLEFSTGTSGLEILAYMPDTRAAVQFLESGDCADLRSYLDDIQQHTHRKTLAIIPAVNEFLHENGCSSNEDITPEEVGEWYSGQEPYYPGTLAVLGLKRLDKERRDRLDIHDPRVFNTKIITPALKALPADAAGEGPHLSLESVAHQIKLIREAGVHCITVLAHPIELTTKGGLSFAQAEALIRDLHKDGHIDGMEVNNSRDTQETTALWVMLANDLRSSGGRKFYAFSFSSDFHVLAPGLATGEITLGFGSLDERPDHRNGNLRPQTTFAHLAREIGFVP